MQIPLLAGSFGTSKFFFDEYFCPTNFCPKLCFSVIHIFEAFGTKPNKDTTETFLQETLVEISALELW